MDFSSINWLAVVACVVASMIIGSIWFSPKTFYPAWWKAIGKTDMDIPGDQSRSGMWVVWVMVVVSSFVQAVFMSLLVNAMGSLSGGRRLPRVQQPGFCSGSVSWLLRA